MPKDKFHPIIHADLGQKRDGTRVVTKNAEGTFAPEAKVAPAIEPPPRARKVSRLVQAVGPEEVDAEAAAQLRRASEPVPVETEKVRVLPAFTPETPRGTTRIVK